MSAPTHANTVGFVALVGGPSPTQLLYGECLSCQRFLLDSLSVSVCWGGSARFIEAEDASLSLVLWGELFGPADSDPFLIGGFRRAGRSFARGLNGSFAALVIDHERNDVYAVTDRLGSQPVFCRALGDQYIVSTSMYSIPHRGAALDYAGLSSYLSNGVAIAGRTPFNGTHVLQQGSTHSFKGGRARSQQYWAANFGSFRQEPEDALSSELADLILGAVEARRTDGRAAVVSLSGGYDSPALLGALHELGGRNIESISYNFGPLVPGSDAYVARAASQKLGIPHRVVSTYDGDLPETLLRNSLQAEGVAHFNESIAVWESMQSELSLGNKAVWFADEAFGWVDFRISSFEQALASIMIRRLPRQPLLKEILGTEFDALRSELDLLYHGLAAQLPLGLGWHDTKDILYLDQRLTHFILPWRSMFVGRFAPVRNPFLDNDILDFMQHVPTRLRRGKRLFRRTVSSRFPSVFGTRRAIRANTAVDYGRELAINRNWLRRVLCSGRTPLDDIVDCERLFEEVSSAQVSNRPSRLSRGRRAVRNGIRDFGPSDALRSLVAPQEDVPIDATTLTIRIAMLRSFLARF